MTTARSTAVLGALALAVTIGSVWVWSADRAATAAMVPRNELMFPALQAAEAPAARIEIELPTYQLVLAHIDDWVAPDEASYPADPQLVERLIGEVSSLRALEPKTTEPALYPKIGLDDADGQRRHLRVLNEAGAILADVLVGNRSSSVGVTPTGGIFLRRPEEARAWLASGSVTLPTTLSDWLVRPLRLRPADVESVKILEGRRAVLAAAKPAGETTYVRTQDTATPGAYVNDGMLKTLTGTLLSIAPTGVRPQATMDISADARTIEMKTTSGLVLTIRTGIIEGATWFAFHADAPPGSDSARAAAEINEQTDGFAFRLSDSITETLTVPIATLETRPQIPNLPPQ